ncbi:MAG: hypothetical protein MZV70_64890 [Desulfobacterales bacterium]|nr:hypothetical protein [Desulfobacterales bacterium]
MKLFNGCKSAHGNGVVEVVDLEVGKAQVAVKRGDYNVTVTRANGQRRHVVAGGVGLPM